MHIRDIGTYKYFDVEEVLRIARFARFASSRSAGYQLRENEHVDIDICIVYTA